MSRHLVGGLLGLVFAAIAVYFGQLTLSLSNPNLHLVLLFSAALAAAVIGVDRYEFNAKPLGAVLGLAALWLVVAFFSTSSMTRAGAYRALLGEVREAKLSDSLPPLDLKDAPLVSYSMAQRAAEKRLSEVPALGSQVELGRMVKQLVAGRPYWVALLEHRGFFKWNETGATPGYVMVSATDPSDVHLVTELKGQKLALRYLTSAFFGNDAKRHLYLNGYATTALTDFTPEIDDEGRPFIVATTFERRVGFGGSNATGVVVMDVQTGESKFYDIAHTPAWIDRIQPEDFIETQLSDYLHLVHGFVNFSDQDRLKISGDMDLVYGHDGRAYFFAGMTSVGRDAGLVGFVLVDSRTKQVTKYVYPGVVESVAQSAAEGMYPEKKYQATNALPFLVAGVPTYVMALQDSTGIARMYAMVAMNNFQKVAVAESLNATARQYQAKLSVQSTQTDTAARVEAVHLRAKVVRISSEVRGGNTYYLMLLQGAPATLMSAGADLSEELSLTREGDVVEVEYSAGTARVANLTSFRNPGLTASAPAAAESASQPQ